MIGAALGLLRMSGAQRPRPEGRLACGAATRGMVLSGIAA